MEKAYKRIDLQSAWNALYYTSKDEARDSLRELHVIDSPEPEEIMKMSLEDLLYYGGWELEEVTGHWEGAEFIEDVKQQHHGNTTQRIRAEDSGGRTAPAHPYAEEHHP